MTHYTQNQNNPSLDSCTILAKHTHMSTTQPEENLSENERKRILKKDSPNSLIAVKDLYFHVFSIKRFIYCNVIRV